MLVIVVASIMFTACGKENSIKVEVPAEIIDDQGQIEPEKEKVVKEHPNGWIPGTKIEEVIPSPELILKVKPTVVATVKGLVVIDAGHQAKGNSSLEAIGPGATKQKAKVASGTRGTTTLIPEFELTLTVAKQLKDAFVAQGHQVSMIRESHDVNISNKERAEIANQAGAEVFVRIHANGSDDSSVHGVLTACQSVNNPYCGAYYSASRKLSDLVVNQICTSTGAKNRGVWETDAMSGTNWCTVPTTIVEMGFMTNPKEDQLMATEDYQSKIVQGIVNGINEYMNQK